MGPRGAGFDPQVPDMSYIVTLEEDENGQLILPLPEDVINQFSISEGDEYSIEITEDKRIVIKLNKE